MSKMTPRKRQAQEMRARIQSVASELFDQEGIENVSMEDIAQAAGCSTGNIYHYFKGKEELAIPLTAHVDHLYAEWDNLHRGGFPSARERLLSFIIATLSISCQDEILYANSFAYSLKYPEKGILAYQEDRSWFRLLGKYVDACITEGSISSRFSSDKLVRELVILHRGLLFQWRIERGGFDIEQVGRHMAEALLQSWM